MKELFFKATNKKSATYGEYRQIEKSGNLELDLNANNDDVITFDVRNINFLNIDCNKKTGTFRIFFN